MWTRTRSPAEAILRLMLLAIGGLLSWAGGMLATTLLAHPVSGNHSAGPILIAMILGLGGLGGFLLPLGIQGDPAMAGAPPVGTMPSAPLSTRLKAAMGLAAVAVMAQVGAAVGAWPPWGSSFRAHLLFWSMGFVAAVAGAQGLAMRRRLGWWALTVPAPLVVGLMIHDVTRAAWTLAGGLNALAHTSLLAAAVLCVLETRWRWALR